MRDLQNDLERTALWADRSRASRRERGHRLAALAVAGCLGLSGVAVAATTIWRPSGPELGGRAIAVDASAPPAAQLQKLGVLRRSATAADRDAIALIALRVAPDHPIRTNYVRRVATGPGESGFVVVPVGTATGAVGQSGRPGGTDTICLTLVKQEAAGLSAGGSCKTTAEILQGQALMSTSNRVYGLVPDGVVRVIVRSRGATAAAPVRDNAFVARIDGTRMPEVTWFGADGGAIRR